MVVVMMMVLLMVVMMVVMMWGLVLVGWHWVVQIMMFQYILVSFPLMLSSKYIIFKGLESYKDTENKGIEIHLALP